LKASLKALSKNQLIERLGARRFESKCTSGEIESLLEWAGSSEEGPIFIVHSIGTDLSRDWGGLEMKI
jgi:hypothetical protein